MFLWVANEQKVSVGSDGLALSISHHVILCSQIYDIIW